MGQLITGELFDYRFKITVASAKVPSNQTNKPVYFDLSDAPSEFWTHVKSDGGDIRVTQSDGLTRQALEVVYITVGSSVGEIHFKASSLSSTVDTVFYIYYGNPDATQPARDAAYGIESVWSNDEHHNVFHFEAKTGNTDSTSYQNDWVVGSGCTLATGKLSGQGMSHNGTTDYGSFPSGSFGSNSDLITYMFWHKSTDTTANAIIFGGRDFATNRRRFVCRTNFSVAGSIKSGYYDDDAPDEEALTGYVDSDVGMQDGTWHHVAVTHDNPNDTIKFYIDSVLQTTIHDLQETPALFSNFTLNFFTGAWNNVGTPGLFHNFVIDEFRLMSTLQDTNFITTTFNNQSNTSTFFTVGAEESFAFTPRIHIF
jgi:hypothetical protein